MASITKIPRKGQTFDDMTAPYLWEETEGCAGFEVSDDCPWRYEEMTLVTFRPDACTNNEIKGCEELVSYARIANGVESK